MGDLRTPRLNMRDHSDQKFKMGDFRRPRPNMGDQIWETKSLPLDLTVIAHSDKIN